MRCRREYSGMSIESKNVRASSLSLSMAVLFLSEIIDGLVVGESEIGADGEVEGTAGDNEGLTLLDTLKRFDGTREFSPGLVALGRAIDGLVAGDRDRPSLPTTG